MPVLKQKPAGSQDNNGEFLSRYTRDADGFYVRNQNPSSGTLSEKRISDNLRELLRETHESKNAGND